MANEKYTPKHQVYGYKPNAVTSPRWQLYRRYGFSKDTKFFQGKYPSFVDSIGSATMTERYRKRQQLLELYASRRYMTDRTLRLADARTNSKSAEDSARAILLEEARRRNSRTYNGTSYLVDQSLGIGRASKSAEDSASVFEQHLADKDSAYWEKIRSAKNLNMQRIIMSAGRRRQQQQDITKGIEGAFGKGGIKTMLRGFGIYAVGKKALNAAEFALYGASLKHAPAVQQLSQASMLAGADIKRLSGLGYALRTYGGDNQQATSLLTILNELQEGAKYGAIPEVFNTLAKRFGISYMQGGKIADSETMIQRISDKIANTRDPSMKAFIARTAKLSGPEFDLMRHGYDEYRKRIANAETGSPYTFGGEDTAKSLAESTGRLSSEFDKLSKSLIHNFTPVVDNIANWLGGVNKDRELQRAIDIAKDRAGYGIFSRPGISGDYNTRSKFFSELTKLGVAEKALEYFRFSDAQRSYAKNYNEWKKWYEDWSRSGGGNSGSPLPDLVNPNSLLSVPQFYTPGSGSVNRNEVNLLLDFKNFDSSKISQGTKDAFNNAGIMLLEDLNPYLNPQLFMGEH